MRLPWEALDCLASHRTSLSCPEGTGTAQLLLKVRRFRQLMADKDTKELSKIDQTWQAQARILKKAIL